MSVIAEAVVVTGVIYASGGNEMARCSIRSDYKAYQCICIATGVEGW
jgi:hypothetical protein